MNGTRTTPAPTHVARAVILGASNCSRGIATAVDTARTVLDGPIDLHVAIGHGRSYIGASTVAFRTLPGIVESDLWATLASPAELPTVALLTDVGTDIMFGASAEAILRTVDTCVARLRAVNATVVITNLATERLSQVNRRQFRAAKTVFFPCHPTTFEQAHAAIDAVAEGLPDIARAHDATLIAPQGAWFGLDPIHITRRAIPVAWRTMLGPWNPLCEAPPVRTSLGRWLTVRPARAHRWSIAGIARQTEQPARALRDGSTISLW
ncbi:MAG: hypothetical protein AAF432_03595 [Planctomycetota bacterium]